MNLQSLTARLATFDGFDLLDSEAAELLNDARRDFARRSKYPRKTVALGSTVSGQSAYAWPEDLLLASKVSIAGNPWEPCDPETVEQFENGSLLLEDCGVWFDGTDESGDRKLTLYPVPSEAAAIKLEYVYRPIPLANPDDEPSEFPEEFHPALLFFVAADYYRTSEDNPELATYNSEKADLAVSELERYDLERQVGNGLFTVGIVGMTA